MRKRNISLEWTKDLSKDKKEEFESLLRSSVTVVTKLKKILEEELKSIESRETSLTDFEDPTWSYKQAFRNGEKARLRKTIDLLNFH